MALGLNSAAGSFVPSLTCAEHLDPSNFFCFSAARPTVQNQGRCASCVNAAIASAVEAAVAAAAGTNGTGAAFSPMYAYYCEPPMLRSCGSGWAFEAALNNLASDTAKFLPNANCTQSVDLEAIRNVAPSQLPAACDTVFNKCSSNNPLAECSYKALSEFWEIQQAVRVNGAVVTRVSVGSNFVEYFQSNPKGVYNTSTSDDSIPHAVILVSALNNATNHCLMSAFKSPMRMCLFSQFFLISTKCILIFFL